MALIVVPAIAISSTKYNKRNEGNAIKRSITNGSMVQIISTDWDSINVRSVYDESLIMMRVEIVQKRIDNKNTMIQSWKEISCSICVLLEFGNIMRLFDEAV